MAISSSANLEGIRQFTETIWDSILGLPLGRRTDSNPLENGSCLRGTVQITGAWGGTVTLYCRPAFAKRAAAIMFGTDPESLTNTEMNDALGELVNMISGQLKALVPEPSVLSIPCIDGPLQLAIPDVKPLARVSFDCAGQPLLLIISDSADNARSAA